MQEWFINSEIAYLHRVISGTMAGSVSATPISQRLFQLGVISQFNMINQNLEKLNNELDLTIKLEGVSIDFDTYLDENYWKENHLFYNEEDIYKSFDIELKEIPLQHEINFMTDYFPNGDKNYNITPELLDTFRTSLYQLCDRNKIGSKEIEYALNFGLFLMLRMLKQIKQKVEHPKPHQYKQVWDEIYTDHENVSCRSSYLEWKEENDDYTFEGLKKQQTLEIFRLLESEFFRFYDDITGAEVKNRKLIITEDELPVGESIYDEFATDCARFEKFFEWKDKYVLSLNYEKLGQYIYKHYKQFEFDEIENIVLFDKTLDAIHEDMAKLKPNLEKYLKNYEEKTIKDLYKECAEILNCCQKHLRDEIRPTFLEEFLAKMLYDKDIKQEAQEKLGSAKFRKKYLCQIIAALSLSYVFKVDIIKSDLADTLGKKLVKPNSKSICDYIEDFQRERKGALYNWTRKIIDELKATPFNYPSGLL